jgi:DNA-binding NtrC family response regulator
MTRILAVDNEEKMCRLIKTALEMESFTVDMAVSGPEALQKIKAVNYDIVITDLKMNEVDGLQVLDFTRRTSPTTEVVMITAYATQDTALEAMRRGAYDYLIKPFKMDELLLRVQRILKQRDIEQENRKLKKLSISPVDITEIVGKSDRMRRVFEQINRVANSDTTVIIRGESGTGKELVARAIHDRSRRKKQAFVAINCAALPENLLESELFGYEKGAFTGAFQTKKGLFEMADGGSLFLDEIGDMPIGLQAKLLRVLENNEVIHLGGHQRIHVDFRLITATNQNLEKLIEKNQFRSDLYYRINIFPIVLPPLRQRKEDIPELIQFFLRRFPDKTLSQQARRQLIEYDYPGNVRELENIITRVALISDSIIDQVDLPAPQHEMAQQDDPIERILDEGITLDDLERQLIIKAIEKASGNKSKAAQLLGITRRRLYSMMERWGMADEADS